MSTTTVIERLPCGWKDEDHFGEGWDEGNNPGEVWGGLFEAWLNAKYPNAHLSLAGNEIIGPATYVYGQQMVQSDTPPIEELPQLPESLYQEFQREWVGGEWYELIWHWINDKDIDFTKPSARAAIQNETEA